MLIVGFLQGLVEFLLFLFLCLDLAIVEVFLYAVGKLGVDVLLGIIQL